MTPVDTRKPTSEKQRGLSAPPARERARSSEPRGRDGDELALAALSAPFPPEPSAEPSREPPPPRDGVEPEDAEDFPGDAPTTVRAPASGVVARSPGYSALLSAPVPGSPPPERALARVAVIVMPAGPGELLVPLPPIPHGPSMLLLAGLTAEMCSASGHPAGLAARLVRAAPRAPDELFELAPLAPVSIAIDLEELSGDAGRGAAGASDVTGEPALRAGSADRATSPAQPLREHAHTPASGFAQPAVAPSRETLAPRRRRKPFTLAAAALALVGATGILARAGLLDGLHLGFDRASSAATALDLRAQRALARPVNNLVPSVMPAAPSDPEPATDDLVERAKRLINAGGQPRLREAQALLEQAKVSDAQNPHVRATLGEVLLQRGVHEAAFTEAAEAVRLRPRRARYRVLLGDVYRALGRAEEAENAYTKAAELDPHGRSVDDVDGASVRALSEL